MPSFDKSKKAGLGRGLGSLLGGDLDDIKIEPSLRNTSVDSAAPSAPKKEKQDAQVLAKPKATQIPVSNENRVWQMDIEKIKPNSSQPRKTFEKEVLRELADSIKAHGVLQPITVRKSGADSYEIIAGERRWRATQLAGKNTIPTIVKAVDDKNSLELALIENIQRADLNPVEEAEAYQLLIDDYDLTQEELSKRVGKERATIANVLRLLKLEPQVRKFLVEGKLSSGHAKVLLTLTDPMKQRQVAKEAVKKQLSVRKLESLVKKSLKSDQDKKDDAFLKDIDIAAKLVDRLTDELQKRMGRKVSIDYNKGKGKIAISFYSDEELSEITERLKTSWKQ